MQNTFDVVIIGGGLSGLTLGAMLGKLGQKCCIVEKESCAGGYLAGFQKRGFNFDTAIHWLNQFGDDGISKRCFSFIGEDYPKPRPLSRIHRYRSDNFNILLQSDLEAVKKDFINNFPREEKGIHKFFRHAEELSHTSLKMSNFVRSGETMSFLEKAFYYPRALPFVIPFLKHLKYTGDEGIKKGLSKYFNGNAIRDVFCAESDLLSCLLPLAWAKNRDYFMPPVGGSVEFVKWLSEKNKAFGNRILLNTEAKSILLEGKTAIGIQALEQTNDIQIKAKYVVAASDLIALYRYLLPMSIISKKKIQILEKSVQYKSAFTVSVALDCPAEELGFGEELITLAKNNLERAKHENSDPDCSKLSIFSPSVRDKSVCPKNHGIVTIYMPADIEKYDFWKTEPEAEGKHKRGKLYDEFKQKIAGRLIDRVDTDLHSDFSKHILFYEVATPITYQRYTANYRGTMMGAKPGKENIQNKVASHFTEIKNLLVGGQWAELGGGVPVTSISAMNTALIIIRRENRKQFKSLTKYFGGKINLAELEVVIDRNGTES